MASKPRVFPCNTCSLTFATGALQRAHMHQAWHIHNLRQRVAGIPAVSKEDYDAQVETPRPSHRHNDSREEQDQMYDVDSEPMPTSRVAPLPAACDEVAPPTRCLFCNVNSQTLDANMEHMASSHGLSIPSTDQISDIESFLSYLAVIVYKYNECLYCGVEKGSVDAVQTHMRDKGHCKIDPAELTDFLDTEEEKTEVEEGATVKLSQTEMRLPSGLHITSSRHTDTTLHRPLRRSTNSRLRNRIDRSTSPSSALTTYQTSAPTSLVLTPHTKTDPHSRQLATRHTMGLAGISTQTLRTLQLVDKKAKTVESVAKARVRHKAEQQPVKTMYYKTENPVYQAG